MLTDVESSTALWERYPEQMSVAIAKHETVISEAVAKHGGQLIRERGEGDSTFAVFTSPSAAVAAASEFARGLIDTPWSEQAPLRVRTSVYTGEVESRDGDYYGTTVNRAARLRSLAFGGQVLLGKRTADLIGDAVPSDAALVDLGPRELKDLAAPEHVYELRLVDADAPPEPLSDADASNALWMERLLSAGFVDRDRERRSLVQAWSAAAAGDRQLVLVEGEPGIGKTSISAAVAHHATVDGGLVMYGRWDEDFLAPFQAFREALGAYARGCPRSILRADLRDHGDEIARLFPEIGAAIGVEPPSGDVQTEAERLRMFEAIDAWLAAIASRRAVCLVLDDLHWADRPSFLFLLHLVRAARRAPLFVVATFRGEAVTDGDPAHYIPEIQRNANVRRVSLVGLGRSDIEDLVEHVSGSVEARSSVLAEELRTETGGNPLFLREMVRHLSDMDALVAADRRNVELPDSIRELVRWRLRPLGAGARYALSVASVIGQEFDAHLLGAASGLEEGAVTQALEESCRLGVLQEAGELGLRFAFSHAVVRRALLDELSGARRFSFHRKIGEALEEFKVDAAPGQLAHHYCASVTPDRAEKAIGYARAAAQAALRELAFEGAIVHLRRALQIQEQMRADDLTLRCALLISLGAAHDRAGEYADRDTCIRGAIDCARKVGRSDLFAKAAVTYGGALMSATEPDHEQIGYLEEALERLPEGDSAQRVLVLGRLAHSLHMLPPRTRRMQIAEEAIAMARRLDDPVALSAALIHRSFALDGPDDLEEQLRTADEIRTLAEGSGDRMTVLRALHLRTDALFEAGRIDELTSTLTEMTALAEELKYPEYLRVVHAWHSVFAGIEGRHDDALRIAGEVREMLAAMDHPSTERDYQGLVFPVHWLRGTLIEGLELYEALAKAATDSSTVHVVVAWITAEAGMEDRAREAFGHISIDAVRELDRNFSWWVVMAGLTSAATLLEDREWCDALYELMLPYADRLATAGSSSFIGSARHHLGALATVLERYDEAEAHFTEAILTADRMGARPWLALSHASFAAMLTRRGGVGDTDRAAELGQQAARVADELGLHAVARRLP